MESQDEGAHLHASRTLLPSVSTVFRLSSPVRATHAQTGSTLLDWLGAHQGAPLGCKEVWEWVHTYGCFLGKYKLIGSVVHSSATCLVIFAEEIDTDRANKLVALKLMHNKAEWSREREMRKLGNGTLDAKHVVPLLHSEELEEDAGLIDSRMKGDNDNLYLLAMPQAKCDLSDVLSHSRLAGRERMKVVDILVQVVGHLKYLNEGCNRIHGDLKSRNLLQLEMKDASAVDVLVWVLTDLDASCEIGSPAGEKITSSACYPPEMARQVLLSASAGKIDSARKIEVEKIIIQKGEELDAVNVIPTVRKTASDNAKVKQLTADIEQLKAELNHSGSSEPVTASIGYEMWYFGCLLYQLCTLDGRSLWDADQADNIEDDQLRQLAYQWPQLKAAKMKKIVWPEAKELGELLLQEDVDDRPHSWDHVLQHPFLAGQSIMDKLNEISRDVTSIKEQMDKVLRGIEVVRRTIVNLDSCPIPTVFVIEPQPIVPSVGIDSAADEATGMLSKFKSMFNVNNPMESAKNAVDQFSTKKMTLRLVCQYTGEPVGDGYEIDQPREVIPKLLPLMSVGLKAMKMVNGVSKLGRLFGLPAPEIPPNWIDSVNSMVDGLGDKGFACVAEVSDKDTQGDLQELSAFQQREFAEFLAKNDEREAWKDVLVRVALQDGKVIWVSQAAHDQLKNKDDLLDGKLPDVDPEIKHHFAQMKMKAKQKAWEKARAKLEPMLSKHGLTLSDATPLLKLVDTMDEVRQAINHPAEFFQKLMREAGPLGVKLATIQLRPKLEPKLASRDLAWDDVLSALELVGSVDEILNAVDDPEQFLQKLMWEVGPVGKKMAVAQLRPKLETHLQEQGLAWVDVLPVVELVGNMEQLRKAVVDPVSFLQKMLHAGGSAGEKMALAQMRSAAAKLRPKLEPRLPHGVAWDDVLPALELVGTVDDLVAAMNDPNALLTRLLHHTGAVGKKMVLAQLRPILEPHTIAQGLAWKDVLPAIELMGDVQELKAAVDEPGAFLQKLLKIDGIVGIKVAIAKLRPAVEPRLIANGLTWDTVLPALEIVGSGDDLMRAIDDPKTFLQTLLQHTGAVGKRMALAHLQPVAEPLAIECGLTWEDAVARINNLNDVDIPELKRAIMDPQSLLDKLLLQGHDVSDSDRVDEPESNAVLHRQRSSLNRLDADATQASSHLSTPNQAVAQQFGAPKATTFGIVGGAERNQFAEALSAHERRTHEIIAEALLAQERRTQEIVAEAHLATQETLAKQLEDRIHDRTDNSRTCAIS